jgi:hypothetical protein
MIAIIHQQSPLARPPLHMLQCHSQIPPLHWHSIGFDSSNGHSTFFDCSSNSRLGSSLTICAWEPPLILPWLSVRENPRLDSSSVLYVQEPSTDSSLDLCVWVKAWIGASSHPLYRFSYARLSSAHDNLAMIPLVGIQAYNLNSWIERKTMITHYTTSKNEMGK